MNAKQNAEVESKAGLALAGGNYRWQDTAIEVTPDAKKTDPVAGALRDDAWWRGLKTVARDGGRNIAFDLAYLAEPLTPNLAETPDGFLICRNAVIGRTGFQTYRVSEITDPEGLLKDDYSPSDEVEVWRDPDEVFSPATLASFEAKSLTLGHPNNLLDPDSDRTHAVGHIQNVRRGREPLRSGDWPMLADVIIKNAHAIAAVKSGERELSCGYTYRLARTGYRWEQRNIVGNHIALVPKGRAGAEARIKEGENR
jgi:hypothetical protein